MEKGRHIINVTSGPGKATVEFQRSSNNSVRISLQDDFSGSRPVAANCLQVYFLSYTWLDWLMMNLFHMG